MHVIESTVASGVVGDRAGKKLIPTGELGELALDVQRVLRAEAQVGAIIGLSHQICAARLQEQGDLLHFEQRCQLMVQGGQRFAERPVRTLGGVLDEVATFLQL
ncbi:hypothetical protein D3C73_692970 [compost metagenome]